MVSSLCSVQLSGAVQRGRGPRVSGVRGGAGRGLDGPGHQIGEALRRRDQAAVAAPGALEGHRSPRLALLGGVADLAGDVQAVVLGRGGPEFRPVVQDIVGRAAAVPGRAGGDVSGQLDQGRTVDVAAAGARLPQQLHRRVGPVDPGGRVRGDRVVVDGADRSPGPDGVPFVGGLAEQPGAEGAVGAEQPGHSPETGGLGDLRMSFGLRLPGGLHRLVDRGPVGRQEHGGRGSQSGEADGVPGEGGPADQRSDQGEHYQRQPPGPIRTRRCPRGIDRRVRQRILRQRVPVLHRERRPWLVLGARHRHMMPKARGDDPP